MTGPKPYRSWTKSPRVMYRILFLMSLPYLFVVGMLRGTSAQLFLFALYPVLLSLTLLGAFCLTRRSRRRRADVRGKIDALYNECRLPARRRRP